jgi:hypothetical protein
MRHVNSERDPATWNLLAGLIKLSDAVQRVQNDLNALDRKVSKSGQTLRRLKP